MLKYFSEPITGSGFSKYLPFWFYDEIKPLVVKNVTLKPDIHTFDVCFSSMKSAYEDSKEDVGCLEDKLVLLGKEALLYISFGEDIFSWHEGVNKKFSDNQEVRVPKIIESIVREPGFNHLLARTKRKIVTYGPFEEDRDEHSIVLNGIGFILSHKGDFTKWHINPPIEDLLSKYTQIKGGFISDNTLKGLHYYIGYKRYMELIR